MKLNGLPSKIFRPENLIKHVSRAQVQIHEPKYTCDQHWMKFTSPVFQIRCLQVCRDAQTHSVTHRCTYLKTECGGFQRPTHKLHLHCEPKKHTKMFFDTRSTKPDGL